MPIEEATAARESSALRPDLSVGDQGRSVTSVENREKTKQVEQNGSGRSDETIDAATNNSRFSGSLSQDQAQQIVIDYLDRRVSPRRKVAHYDWGKAVSVKPKKDLPTFSITTEDTLTIIYHEYREYEVNADGGIGELYRLIRRTFYIKDGAVVTDTP